MRRMGAFFAEVWDHIVKFFSSYNYLIDTLDILLVAFAIYSLIKLVRDSRAEQLLKGLCLLGIAYGMAHLLQLTTLKYLLKIVFDNALIVLVVISSPKSGGRSNRPDIPGHRQAQPFRGQRRGKRAVCPELAAGDFSRLRGRFDPPAAKDGGAGGV